MNSDDLRSLNFELLDIEALEQRIELATMIMPVHGCTNNTCQGYDSGSCSGNSCVSFGMT